MKFTKRKDYDGSIRKVWNDEKTECYGMVGTVDDLLNANILEYCNQEKNMFCAIDMGGKAYFGKERNEIAKMIIT